MMKLKAGTNNLIKRGAMDQQYSGLRGKIYLFLLIKLIANS